MFFRINTDRTRVPVPLANLYAGPMPSTCWLIGGGPSLAQLPCDQIAASPVPKMGVNLAGTRLVRPNFWTSYDPSVRFHRSVYLDPSILKFVHTRRATDLVPESTYKVCDCPNLVFFERDGRRGFADLLDPNHETIVDWQDSMLQAIDILYHLGFRRILIAGCELHITPSEQQQQLAERSGVTYRSRERLDEWLARCKAAGLTGEQLEGLPLGTQYHFDEKKSLAAAANTDFHYFRVAQYLRLSRRSLALAGLELISVTPNSRLNDYFPYVCAATALREIRRTVGDPPTEPTLGLYTEQLDRTDPALGPMKDFRPHNWAADDHLARPTPQNPRRRLRHALDNIPEIEINELE